MTFKRAAIILLVVGLVGMAIPGQAIQIEVGKTSVPMKIDGRIDEPEWKRSSFVSFGSFSGSIVYDQEFLYLAFKGPVAEKPKGVGIERLHDMFKMSMRSGLHLIMEEVEFKGPSRFYHLKIYPGVGWEDYRDEWSEGGQPVVKEDMGWDASLEYQESLSPEGVWTVEIRWPLDSVRLKNLEGVKRRFQVVPPGSRKAPSSQSSLPEDWHVMAWDVWRPSEREAAPPSVRYLDPAQVTFEEKRRYVVETHAPLRELFEAVNAGASLKELRGRFSILRGQFVAALDLWNEGMDTWPHVRALFQDHGFQAMMESDMIMIEARDKKDFFQKIHASEVPKKLPEVDWGEDSVADEPFLAMRKNKVESGYRKLFDLQQNGKK